MNSAGASGLAQVDAAEPEILLVIGSLGIGGTEQQLVMLASQLQSRRYRVAVYSLAGGPLLQSLKANGVTTIVGRAQFGKGHGSSILILFNLAVAAAHLLGVLIRRRPAIVHFFLPEAYLIGAPLAAIVRTPVRIMSRRSLNVYQRGYPRFFVRIEHWLHRTMMAILGNSKSVVQQLHECEGVDARRLGLIYNGLDLARFATGFDRAAIRASARAALGLLPEALVMVMVANLIGYKGHLDLLEALAAASPRLPAAWRLLLVGRDEGIGTQLRARALALAMENNVVFLDSRSDVPEILIASDIGVLCSHQEGFSNAVLEGMAAALPMIVTTVGGNPEAIIDGETGLVVPPHEPPRLGDAIVRLADDADLRARFGDAARARVAAHFSLEQCVANHDALYRLLLTGGVPGDLPQIRAPL
jgi:glycosyltransferase involved in cell wall biosynthesis